MNELILAFLFVGSFSAGYSLLRIGFPQTQKRNAIEKITLGYILGISLIGIPSVLIELYSLELDAFIAILIFTYWALYLILLVKRLAFREADPQIEIKRTKKSEKDEFEKNSQKNDFEEEKFEKKKITFEDGLVVKGKTEKQVFKEEKGNRNNKTSEQREDALKKLRELAQGIKETKKEKDDEIDEDFLNNLSDEEQDEYG